MTVSLTSQTPQRYQAIPRRCSRVFRCVERLSQLNIDNLADELYFPNAHSTHQATVGESINARLSMQGVPSR